MAREYKIRPLPGVDDKTPAIEKLTEESPMPYGKYGPPPKGTGLKMKDVPAGYLLYIYDVDDGLWLDGPFMGAKQKAVRAYIVENFRALECDCPDFNVKHHPEKKRVGDPKFRD